MLRIRDLRVDEIPLLKGFPPAHWKVDLPAIFALHYGQPYFHALAAEWDGALVGCAQALVNGPAGWLGNIIVLPDWRGRGIGTALTQRLIESLRERNVEHQILVATSLGEPVYRKLGFEKVCDYIFFDKTTGSPPLQENTRVRRLEAAHTNSVFALDRRVTGEDRPAFLSRYFNDAWVHLSSSGQVDGFYLPLIGTGLVIAEDDEAGLALMRCKLDLGAQACVLPEGNRVAADFLLTQGFTETSRAPRMVLGGDVDWQPAQVFCRGSGFCG